MNKIPYRPVCQPFSCERGGLTIRGLMYRPQGLETPAPAVVLSHGFLCDHTMCDGYASALTRLGYVTFTFDFCGGSPNSASDGLTRDMSVLTELQDLLSVYAYVKTLPFVDRDHISLLGCSQGGYVSAMAAKQLADEIDRLVLFYPALCIPDDARKGQMQCYCFDPQNIPDTLGAQPMELGGCYARAVVDKDPYEQITGFTGPVLILHGDQDALVQLSYSQKAVTCYPDCRLAVIRGAGHVFFGDRDEEAKQILCAFMQREE